MDDDKRKAALDDMNLDWSQKAFLKRMLSGLPDNIVDAILDEFIKEFYRGQAVYDGKNAWSDQSWPRAKFLIYNIRTIYDSVTRGCANCFHFEDDKCLKFDGEPPSDWIDINNDCDDWKIWGVPWT